MDQRNCRNQYDLTATFDDKKYDYLPLSPELQTSKTRYNKFKVAVLVVLTLLMIFAIARLNQVLLSESIKPHQVHLSLGENDNVYYVSWATEQPANCQLVWYKNASVIETAQGIRIEALFEEESEDDRKSLFTGALTFSERTFRKNLYHAKMTVEPGAKYYYYIVSSFSSDSYLNYNEESERYYFETKRFDDPNRELKLLFYGDLGLRNAQSVPRIYNEVLSEEYDLIIHNGDFAYDLDTDRGNYGDQFMSMMEPIAARIPYQTSVGNHEVASNFTHYDRRFKMVNRGSIKHGQANNFYYSFNAGPVHFIAISTEFYYFLDYAGLAPLMAQYEWLKADLAVASSAHERAKRPWIIVFGHRPMYCSSRDNDDCTKDNNLLRRGLPFTGTYALEKLFFDHGVDMELYSHEHMYERFLPIYDGNVYNGTDNPDNPYQNPKAPVHIISGSAGCQEKLDPLDRPPKTGSVRQIRDYGYTRIYASRDKLHLEQVSDDQAGTITDEFDVSKDRQNFPFEIPL